MRALFGVISLLVVLAVVGMLATKQLKAVGSAAAPGASSPVNLPMQSQQLQQRVTDDVAKALQQGAKRSEDADQ